MNAPEFYTVFARLYDRLARVPGVGRLRRRLATALAPAAGDTVLDVGCGTGANHPHLRREIGPEGQYVGLDFSPGVLRIAHRREGGERRVFVRGDATRPPVPSGVPDAVCASFLVGMLTEPAAAVRRWARLVGAGGRVALLNLSRAERLPWRVLNPAFRLFVRLGSPPGGATERGVSPVERLERRVTAAHDELTRLCETVTAERETVPRDSAALTRERGAFGFARLTAGTVRDPDEW
ncbi:MAG: class I SAM-dependent methyltransferase [Halobaculum sp.]